MRQGVARFRLQALAAASLSALGAAAQAQTVAPDAAALQLPAVTVQGLSYGAGAVSLPSTITVLDQQQLTEGQLQVNTSEVLNQVPGLVVNNRQDYAQDMQLSIRGWGADSAFGVQDVVMNLDGIPLTMPDGQGQIQIINLPTIGDISVIKGPFAALYGNAAGGVIQAYTRDPADPPSLSLSSWAGAWNSHQTTLVGSDSHGDWGGVAGISDFSTDGWRAHSAADRHQFNGVLSLDPDSDNHYTVVLNAFDQQAQDPGGLTSAALQQNPRQANANTSTYNTRKSTQNGQTGLVWEHSFDADDKLSASIYAGNRNIVQYLALPTTFTAGLPNNAGGVVALDDDFGGSTAQFTHAGAWQQHAYSWSAGVDWGSLDEFRKGYANSGGNIGALTNDQFNTVDNLAQYLQAHVDLSTQLSLSGGLRHDLVRYNFHNAADSPYNPGTGGGVNYGSTDPVVGLLYKLAPGTEAYLDYGHGFVAPTSYQLAYLANGNPGPNLGLQAMHLKNTELGLRSERDGIKLDASVYAVSADNQLVVQLSSNGRNSYFNAGSTFRWGSDISLEAQLPQRFSVRLAYGLSQIHFTDGVYNGNTMPGAPRQQLEASLSWRPLLSAPQLQGFYTTLAAQARSQVYVNVANNGLSPSGPAGWPSAPGWLALNWSTGVEQSWGAWRLSEFLRVDNLLNRNYVGAVVIADKNGNYFEAAPTRNASAGASLTRSF